MTDEKESKDFKLSQEETDRLHEAFKKPEFRKLLAQYAQEMSDPENKKKYEEELVALEKQGGVDMTCIHPQPGFVVKAFLKPECSRKLFINVCHSNLVEAATSTPAPRTSQRGRGDQWNIPYMLTPPRDDLDKSNNRCTVVDAIFNTEAFAKGIKEPRFRKMLLDTVLDGLEKQLELAVDRDKLIQLRTPYKGVPTPAVIRKRAQVQHAEEDGREVDTSGANPLNIPFPPLPEEDEARSHKDRQTKKNEGRKLPAQPKYTVVHRGEFSMQDFTNDRRSTLIKRPKELVINVEMPGVESATLLDLEIFEKRVALQCSSPLYELDLPLAYAIDEEEGRAQYDKARHILSITLPVLPLKTPVPLPPSNAVPSTDTQETDQDSVLPLKTTVPLPPPSNAVPSTDTQETDQDSVLPLKTTVPLPPPSNAVPSTDTQETDQDSVLPLKTPVPLPPPSNAVPSTDTQETDQDSVLPLKTPVPLPPPSNAVPSTDTQETDQDSVLPLKTTVPLPPPSNAVPSIDTQETDQDSPLKTPVPLPPPFNAVPSTDTQETDQDSVLPLKTPVPLPPPSNAVPSTDTQETDQDSVLPLKTTVPLPPPSDAVPSIDTQETDQDSPLKTQVPLPPPSNAVPSTDTQETDQDSVLPLKTPVPLPPPSNAVPSIDTQETDQDSVLPLKTPVPLPPPSNAVPSIDTQETDKDSPLKTQVPLPPPSNAVPSTDTQETDQDSVLPPKTPVPLPPPSNAVPSTDTQDAEQDPALTSLNLSRAEKGEALEVAPPAEASASGDCNSPSPVSAPATAGDLETTTKASPGTDVDIASPITAGEVQDWSSKGHWVCPQFSYRQDNAVVVFCLHTVGVKERSLVQLFDDHSAQVTFSTSREHYSFHASFPKSCGLDVDDCTVDISCENVVLLLKKVAEGSGCLWERFHVGLNASQTTEKLFLTVSNAQSVIDDLTDPWEQSVWSDQATVSATLIAGGDQVDLVISDPAASMKSVASLPDSAAGMSTTSKVAQSLSTDLSPMATLSKDLPHQNGTPAMDNDQPICIGPPSGALFDHGLNTGVERVDGVTSPSFKVEADGSIFVHGDENHTRDSDVIRPILTGQKDTIAPINKLKLSNKLAYMLD